jgi:TRAP-type C4-dicarboxylate transport system substrate-binding protein
MWDGFWLLGNRRAFDRLPPDARDVVNREYAATAFAERADLAALGADARGTLEKNGLAFNTVDQASFRDALKAAGFYKDWRDRYGEDAWHVLEDAVGKVS